MSDRDVLSIVSSASSNIILKRSWDKQPIQQVIYSHELKKDFKSPQSLLFLLCTVYGKDWWTEVTSAHNARIHVKTTTFSNFISTFASS